MLIVITWAAGSKAAELEAAHHIQIELFPAEMKLAGSDNITVKTNGVDFLEFHLSEHISQLKLEVNRNERNFDFENGRLRLSLEPDEQSNDVQVTVYYSAKFDDPVPVRPVNTDNPGFGVTGTISEKGCFLLSGAGWYPELVNSRATYKVDVRAPAGLIAVTAGRSLGHLTENGKTVSKWEVNYPIEGLSLSAARYEVEKKTVGKVTAVTYLLPANKHLAPSYLEATAKYISLYADLFGPYPFQKFAVVENFFPTGYGFPSYTLMGGSVLRLPFIIYTSLGHEIAHCWWGNGVYVDYAEGNWSEGLTTYVADYLFKEMKSKKTAMDYRRQWLRNYSTLARPDNDVALDRFQSRYNPVSKAIGYDKAAMVFHMIRKRLGEEAFWGALRDIYRDRIFKRTSWSDLQRAFEARGKQPLQGFFDQWVHRKGAPRFRIDSVTAEPTDDIWKVSGRIIQNRSYYEFPLVLALKTREKTVFPKIKVSGQATSFELTCDAEPLKLTADPDYDVFRRLYPSEIPPAVNAFKGSPSVVTVLSNDLNTELERAARTLVLSLGLKHNEFVSEDELSRRKLVENDILIIGQPRQKDLLQKMPNQVSVHSGSFTLNNTLYSKPSDAFFGVFHHPVTDNRIAALFIPSSNKFADIVARKITHYGKYSYLAFQLGKNTDKGTWTVEKSPLMHEWNLDK
jgi:hypothetical protein